MTPKIPLPVVAPEPFCLWCSAPRDTGNTCPRCGADYAKAEAIKAHGRAAPATEPPSIAIEIPDAADVMDAEAPPAEWKAVDDPVLEYRFCLGAIPIMLCIAMVFHASGLGASLQRIFLTMPVHEFGHAVTAWLCGFSAIPTLWKTLIPEERGFIVPLALAGLIGYGLFRAWRARILPLVVACGALLALQAIGTLIISTHTAHIWITFGGDGMGMVLAILLMASFYFGKHTQLYQGSLRWGFVAIGAAAFVDIYATWWKSRKDEGAIPFGTMDGIASDAMKLVENYGWSHQTMVNRYFVLGLCCLLALVLVYAWGAWRAKSEIEARRDAQRKMAWGNRKRVSQFEM